MHFPNQRALTVQLLPRTVPRTFLTLKGGPHIRRLATTDLADNFRTSSVNSNWSPSIAGCCHWPSLAHKWHFKNQWYKPPTRKHENKMAEQVFQFHCGNDALRLCFITITPNFFLPEICLGPEIPNCSEWKWLPLAQSQCSVSRPGHCFCSYLSARNTCSPFFSSF
jgi:hypothetical protein